MTSTSGGGILEQMRRTEPTHQAAKAARLIPIAAALLFCLGAATGCAPNRLPPLQDDPAKADSRVDDRAARPGTVAASAARPERVLDLPEPKIRSRLGESRPAGVIAEKSGRRSRGPAAGDAATLAEKYLGTPYVFGGSTPKGFDCSGLVQYVYRRFGVKLPRKAIDQSRTGSRLGMRELRRNDLVFFRTRGSSVSHVGIYLGEGDFIHAPGTGKHIRTDSLDNPWWRKRLVLGRRVI